MTLWPAVKARLLLASLIRIGWTIKRQTGSHKILRHADHADFVFAFHVGEEIVPRMLARIVKRTGLKVEDTS
jgi:predicted RNA binding protein YcfA (HicA-like mRNA interferase family)